jgi:hypothetical protein
LMLKLQEELKSGNLSVGNSKRFGRFDDYSFRRNNGRLAGRLSFNVPAYRPIPARWRAT